MGKLVRDRVPELINASGRTATVRRLDDRAYIDALHGKLFEEAAELRDADSALGIIEEAGDVLEVLTAIAAVHGRNLDDIIEAAAAKRVERGGFQEGFWLEGH